MPAPLANLDADEQLYRNSFWFSSECLTFFSFMKTSIATVLAQVVLFHLLHLLKLFLPYVINRQDTA